MHVGAAAFTSLERFSDALPVHQIFVDVHIFRCNIEYHFDRTVTFNSCYLIRVHNQAQVLPCTKKLQIPPDLDPELQISGRKILEDYPKSNSGEGGDEWMGV